MRKLAYEFGVIGYFAIFTLCAFEQIMMSVNSYGFDTIASLYLFFGLNIVGFVIFVLSIVSHKNKRIHISFNLCNKGIAILYLGVTVFSVLFLINSSKYNLATNSFWVLLKGFIFEPEIYLPMIPVLVSGVLFIVSSREKNKVQKPSFEEGKRVSHL